MLLSHLTTAHFITILRACLLSTKLQVDLVAVNLGIKRFKGYYQKRLIQIAVYSLDNKLPNPYIVMQKMRAWISRSWNSMKVSLIQNLLAESFIADLIENAELILTLLKTPKHTDLIENAEDAGSLFTTASAFQILSNQSFPLDAKEFLNLQNDVQVYSGRSDEDILAELLPIDQ